MVRVILAAGAAAVVSGFVYFAMSPAQAASHCYIDPAFGSCSEATSAPGS
jgi:hypothetical protein